MFLARNVAWVCNPRTQEAKSKRVVSLSSVLATKKNLRKPSYKARHCLKNKNKKKKRFHTIFINRKLTILMIYNKCFKHYYMYKYFTLIFRDKYVASYFRNLLKNYFLIRNNESYLIFEEMKVSGIYQFLVLYLPMIAYPHVRSLLDFFHKPMICEAVDINLAIICFQACFIIGV